MISYYELLGMIKEDKAPNKIRVHLTREPRIYEAQYDESDFSHYFIYDGDNDDDYHHYLSECFLESDMFDKNIEIIEEEKKIPEKVDRTKCVDFADTLEKTLNTLDSLIDYLKSKGDE